jgi:hypothetical protein
LLSLLSKQPHVGQERERAEKVKMSQHAAWPVLSYGWVWSNGAVVISGKKWKKLERNQRQCPVTAPK